MMYYDLGPKGNGWAKTTFARQAMKADAYLVCPGPSLANANITTGRGRKVFAINTAYPRVQPDVWMGLDTVECYDRRLWAEPFIKICRGNYGDMMLNGEPIRYFDNVYFASTKEPEKGKTMFDYRNHDDTLCWYKNTLASMLHLIVWMGAKKVHFVGCDMGGEKDYHDDRKLTKKQREYNRRLYRNQVGFLKEHQKLAKQYGIEFISCTPGSPLNEFMEYKELDTAIKDSEEKVKVENGEMKHCLDAPRDKKTLMHCNNFADLGGIETTVIDIAKAMPEYNHVLCSVRWHNYNKDFIEYIEKLGIKHLFGPLHEAAKKVKPHAIFLHNTHQFKKELDGYKLIGAHHGVIKPYTPCDFDWFVSDWVRDGYDNVNGTSIVMPPPVFPDELLKIRRNGRKPVVGRIQSNTWAKRGKTTDEYYDMLRQLKGCDYFIVGEDVPEDFNTAPILPGKMTEYLSKIDVFTIWGNTTETWSKVVTEANLSGIPVVARNHNDGLAEQIRKSGGGVLVNTRQGFIENVQYFIDNPDRAKEVAERGKAWLLKNATTDVFTSMIKEVL